MSPRSRPPSTPRRSRQAGNTRCSRMTQIHSAPARSRSRCTCTSQIGRRRPARRAGHQQPGVDDGPSGHRRQPQCAGMRVVLQAHGRVHPAAARRGPPAPGDARLPGHLAARDAADGPRISFGAPGYLTGDLRARHAGEWLGGTWGHAAAPSTPPRTCGCTCAAWQHHFAAIFGVETLGRVRGFSPA